MSDSTTDKSGNTLTRDWQSSDHSHYLHPFTDHKDLGSKGTRIITHASGVYITDSEGHQILDGMAGLWCVNPAFGGHSHQYRKLVFNSLFIPTRRYPG